MIPLKSEEDLRMLRHAGKILAKIMQALRNFTEIGVSTSQIDNLAEELMSKENVLPAFKGYQGYPATICASINEEVIHGIPGDRKLKDGDIIGIDAGINYMGYFCDAAVTFGVGKIDPRMKKLMDVAKTALSEGIKQARPDNHLQDISYAIQCYVERNGFSVVRQFVGHGIGRNLHEEPEVPNFGMARRGPVIKAGMVVAIEPMVNMGTWETQMTGNGWTAVTCDGLPSAHFEHTVAITDNGPEILTK